MTSPISQHQPHYRHSMTGKPKLGTYEIDKTIGKGIFSVVKLATHTITGINLAIKLIDKTRLDAENLIKIYRESEILKKLHHPNIVRLFQVMETPRLLCLVMEFLPNGEVFDYIATHGRFSEDQARVKFMDVLCAVDYAHSCGIVHRDLKAENLLFDADMNIKLIDFSFGTHHLESSSQPLLTTWCGSPPYAAPEIFKGEPYVGAKADIWSLGVVLYVMVCGTLPFDAQPLPHLKKQVLSASFRVPYWLSLSCERLIRVMLAKVPAKRPSTRELFQHPWFTDSSSQNPAQFSGSAATCVSSSSSAIPIPNHGVSDRWTRSSSPHSVRRLDTNVNPQNSPKRKALVEPDSDLAADVEKGKLNEFIILIMESYGMKRSQILESLSRRAYDHLMATYLLLGEKVRRHRYSLQLPLRSDHHLVTCSVPVKMKPTSSSPPGPVRGLVAKQSRVDSAVDIKSIISESDSNATSSFSIPVSDTESNVLCHLSSTLWGDAPASYERFSFDDQSGMGQPRQGQLTVPTSQQPPSYVCDIQLGKSFEDSLIASFEPNQRVTFNDQDQTSRPWLIGGNYTLDDKGPANEPPRRTLVRRKYGVFDPPAHLEQLTQSLLAERYNTDSTPPADLDSNDDG